MIYRQNRQTNKCHLLNVDYWVPNSNDIAIPTLKR